MSELNELERLEEQRELDQIAGIPRHIEINERSLKAFDEEFAKKGLQIEQHKDYPREDFHLVKNQKRFDSLVDKSKGIQKKIGAMVRQPVTFVEDGKTVTVTKDALYYYGY
jgi:hypothetical protein